MTLDLILIGFGHVGRRFAQLIDELGVRLRRDHDLDARVVGIATRSHGCVYDPGGVDALALAERSERGQAIGRPASSLSFLRDALRRSAATARSGRLVVVETTTLDIARGQPAIAHVRTALAGGAHVVTANKGPAAFAYRTLDAAARRADRRFLFESAVLDGVPIFNMARAALPAASVTGFRGVVNSTTNHILTALEDGQPFDGAVAAMQAAGIAEADPSLDVDGWDAAAKTAALANVLLGARLTPQTIEREGLTAAAARRAIAARSAGRRLKLVASADRDGATVRARVQLLELPGSDLLAELDGQQNAIVLTTDMLGEIAIVQRGSGLTATAYGLVADLVTIARDRARRATPPPPTRARFDRSPSTRGRRQS